MHLPPPPDPSDLPPTGARRPRARGLAAGAALGFLLLGSQGGCAFRPAILPEAFQGAAAPEGSPEAHAAEGRRILRAPGPRNLPLALHHLLAAVAAGHAGARRDLEALSDGVLAEGEAMRVPMARGARGFELSFPGANPSTGALWQVRDAEAFCELQSNRFTDATSGTSRAIPLVGLPQTQVQQWTCVWPKGRRATALILAYGRPWDMSASPPLRCVVVVRE